MAHPFAAHREDKAARARAKHIAKGYKRGGKVHSDEAEDRKLFKSMMKNEDKGESKVQGRASGGRLDKFARGGHAKGKHKGGNHVNIAIVAPHGRPPLGQGAAPAAPGVLPPPGGGLPPPPMGGPPGGPPGMPPGMPPGPMKRGGRAFAKGGKVNMTAGSLTGEGRKQKKKAYGLSPLPKG